MQEQYLTSNVGQDDPDNRTPQLSRLVVSGVHENPSVTGPGLSGKRLI
jgi:hypothetical protein